MKNKIIVAGHICLDITPVFPQCENTVSLSKLFVPGKLINVDNADIHTGGCVSNTGLALKKLGKDVALLGKIGADQFGAIIKDIFDKNGVGGIVESSDCITSYSIVLAVPGTDRIFLHNPGANNSFSSSDIDDKVFDDAALFHFGYPPLMKNMFSDGGTELARIFQHAKCHDVATSLDMAAIDASSEAGKADWLHILKKTLPYVDFFVPSFEELCFMLDRACYYDLIEQGGDVTVNPRLPTIAERLIDKCLDMGCGTVILKCGLSGIFYKTADIDRISKIGSRVNLDVPEWICRGGHCTCFVPDVFRSGTGAGDTSIAAFLASVVEGESPENCVELAAAEGAASVSSYDALGGVLPLNILRQRIKNGWKKANDTMQGK